jgi:ubiquinone/menaquinone biosynthesis C-methylase UbiE
VDLFSIFLSNARAGLRSAIKGVDYFRAIEYQILAHLESRVDNFDDKLILDLACGEEILPLVLWKCARARVVAIDYSFSKLLLQGRMSAAISNPHRHPIALAQMDGLKLAFLDNSFDIVINLAMISLLDSDRDRLLINEIVRVLRPGGYLFISLGFCNVAREGLDARSRWFFRRYDDESLINRIIGPSGLNEVDRVYFGETGFKFSERWYRLPFLCRLPVRWASPLFAALFCSSWREGERSRADGVFLLLHKV